MCGIAGWYRRGGRPVDAAAMARACAVLVHRGPDDSGQHGDGDFAFAMRRLAIIDVAGGQQPLFAPGGQLGVVFNGEIANCPELRAELAAGGWAFRTRSDTEVVLAAFATWGNDAWRRLEGMFAVAVWDARERCLTLARDPLGIKPLHFMMRDGGVAFASEIRALRAMGGRDFNLDERAVHDFFVFGHVLKPRTIWHGVQSLEPGHFMTLAASGQPRFTRYWKPLFMARHDLSEAAWIAQTRDEVRGAVSRHMLADVPVGLFLSGGVDSAVVAAAMARRAGASFTAFTLGLPGSRLDESADAARIARHLGLEHRVLPLEPLAAGEALPQVQAAFDEPCAATAAVPFWHLARMAADHVKVVLTGEGADEVFAGYKRQRTALLAARLRPLLRLAGPLANAADLPGARWQALRRLCLSAGLDSGVQQFFQATQITTPWLRERLLEPDFSGQFASAHPFADWEAEQFGRPGPGELDPLDQFLLADLTVHLPSSLLPRTDLASMAHGLEARVPFLSHRLVDWALTMPRGMKLRGRTGKYTLRQAFAADLPPGALEGAKRGFQLPFAEWFSGGFAPFAREAWAGSGARRAGFLRESEVERLFADHAAGRADHGRILFALAMFACWWEQNAHAG